MLCVFALAWGCAAVALADGARSFALETETPPDAHCTSALSLKSAIEQRIDRLVFLEVPMPTRHIRVKIARGEGWDAELQMRDEQGQLLGERHVSAAGSRCDELDDGLIVVIGTLIGSADPPPTAAKETTRRVPPSAAESAPTPGHAAGSSARPSASAAKLALGLNAAARGDLGALPRVAPGAALAIDLDLGSWGLLFGASFLPHARQQLADSAAASFRLIAGEAQLCWEAARPLGSRLAFCAGAQVGAIQVRTSGLEVPADRTTASVRALFGPRLRVPLTRRFGLLAGVEAAIPILGARFYVTDASGERDYYHELDFGLIGELGLYWHFLS